MKLFHVLPMIAAASAMSPCIISTDCEDGEVCNMDQAGGFCELCPGETNEDCIDAGYNTELGTAECQSFCVDDAASESTCITSADCKNGEVCNMDDGEAGGYCELCPGETVDDCIDATYITPLGTAECQSVCVNDAASVSSCITSADCEDGEVCNMDGGTSGFCELCPGETNDDCIAAGYITPLGTVECQSVCVDDAAAGSPCKTSADCEDGELCNMDRTTSGFCELCPGETTEYCLDAGYITSLGTAECQSVCVVGKITTDDKKSGFQVNSVSLAFIAAMTIFK